MSCVVRSGIRHVLGRGEDTCQEDLRMSRPRAVTIIAYVWIGLGLLAAVTGGAIVLDEYSCPVQTNRDLPAQTSEQAADVFDLTFRHFDVLGCVQVLLGILMVGAGVGLFGLRPWARTALEVISWAGLVFSVVFGVYFVVNLLSGLWREGEAILAVFGVVSGVAGTALWVVLLVVMIRFLRSSNVRSACSGDGAGNQSRGSIPPSGGWHGHPEG